MKRAVLIGVVVCATGIIALAFGRPAEAQDPSARILTNLQAAAERGDSRAREALDDLAAFARQSGIDLAAVAAKVVTDAGANGHVNLRASGVAPFWIDVFEAVRFDSSYGIDSYAIERRAAAQALQGDTAHRGRLSMVGFVDVDRLCELREASASVVLDADVDVWLGDTWVTRFGYGPDKPAFWSVGCSALVARIRAYLAEAHSGDRLGASVNDARLTIHSATLSVGTLGLAQLSDQPDVLLFDPEEDLLAPWARLAAQVRLVAPIDAFAESIRAKVAAGDILEPFVPGALSKPKGDQR